MGCLFELFFEMFFQVIFEGVAYIYIKLVTLVVPDHTLSEKTLATVKTIITMLFSILMIALIIGLLMVIQDDLFIKNIGWYLTYIPLTIIGVQIVLGISVKLFIKK